VSSRNEAGQTDVYTSGLSRNTDKQQRQASQPSSANREEVLRVNQLAKQMAQLEQSLNGLYDAYENDGRRFEQGKLIFANILLHY
jgi:hypothetical protein